MQLPGGAGLHHQRRSGVRILRLADGVHPPGNALYQADPAAWQAIRDSLPDTVRADLASNNAYWASFEGAAADASQKVYDTILKGYGQEDGIRSYGTVVDLLVAYYRDTARTNGSEGLTT